MEKESLKRIYQSFLRLYMGTFWISLRTPNSKKLRLPCLLIYDRKEIILYIIKYC